MIHLINLVEAGHRAIMFNRMGGISQDTIHSEGLHFKIPYFQWPIMYDIRAKPRLIKSPTGSKGKLLENESILELDFINTGSSSSSKYSSDTGKPM